MSGGLSLRLRENLARGLPPRPLCVMPGTHVAYQPRRALRAVGCMRLFGGLPPRVADALSGSHLHGRVEVDLSRGPAGHHPA